MQKLVAIVALSATLSLGLATSMVAQAQTSMQNLRNGNYKVCSNPPSANRGNDDSNAGYCFVFSKQGNRLVGNYYDPKTLGEVSVCLSGAVRNNTFSGEGREIVGEIGRQTLIPNSEGEQFVNWDDRGYLKVRRATSLRPARHHGTIIRYRSALLNLSGFHRYNLPNGTPPRSCQ